MYTLLIHKTAKLAQYPSLDLPSAPTDTMLSATKGAKIVTTRRVDGYAKGLTGKVFGNSAGETTASLSGKGILVILDIGVGLYLDDNNAVLA